MTVEKISSFSGPYEFLSNFFTCLIKRDGLVYPSVEHAYQAAKAPMEERHWFTSGRANWAKKRGRSYPLPENWEETKVQIMRECLEQKFALGEYLADRLITTGNAYLEEGNWWGDTFWGVCRGIGKTHSESS